MKIRMLLPLSLCLAATACMVREPPPAGTAQCTTSKPAPGIDRVHVDIVLTHGRPDARPRLCVVRSGMEIVWRTAEQDATAFKLVFADSPGHAAAAAGERERLAAPRQFPSHRQDGRQQVGIIAKEVGSETPINYDIVLGAMAGDPGIKIVPR